MARSSRILPGFGLSMGVTMALLSVVVLLPLTTLFFKTATLGWDGFLNAIATPRVYAALRLTFAASAAAAVVNSVFGVVVAWVLVRYSFPGKKIVDGIVDLPFVVRTVQPVLEDFDTDMEEAAEMLGASRAQTVWRVVFPVLIPSILTGFTLAFARALGEYGSVVFIAGNMPMKTEISSLLIMTKLEQYDYAGATAIAVVMLVISFVLLLLINLLQRWTRLRHGEI